MDIRPDYHVYTTALSAIGGYDFGNGIIPEGGLRMSRVSRNSYSDTSGRRIAKDNMNTMTLVEGARFIDMNSKKKPPSGGFFFMQQHPNLRRGTYVFFTLYPAPSA